MIKLKQFATAWTTESITKTGPIQVLVYMWREKDVTRAHHHAVTCGGDPCYIHFSLIWKLDDEDKAGEYFNQCKINGSETRVDVEKILKKTMDEALLPAGWES